MLGHITLYLRRHFDKLATCIVLVEHSTQHTRTDPPLWKHKWSKEPPKSTLVAHVDVHSTNMSRAQSLEAASLLATALHLLNFKSSGHSILSLMISAYNAPFCCQCLSTTHLTSRCSLVLEQVRTSPIVQHTAKLLWLLSRRTGQLYREQGRTPDPQTRESTTLFTSDAVVRYSSFYTVASRAGFGNCRLAPVKILKRKAINARPFENLDCPLTESTMTCRQTSLWQTSSWQLHDPVK